jgi:hypothetical protein
MRSRRIFHKSRSANSLRRGDQMNGREFIVRFC